MTNKTVSRWENGNYMPDIEMLSLLSKEFDVSINELISGKRLDAENFKKAADDNLVTALDNNCNTTKQLFKQSICLDFICDFCYNKQKCASNILFDALKQKVEVHQPNVYQHFKRKA